jgi:glycosyltransferase involved in cell wall biosynthesis
VVYNGYNKFLYRPIVDKEKTAKILAKYGIEGPYMFYVGRLEKKKNTPALIEAFSIFKDRNRGSNCRLVLAGDASYGYDEVNYTIREFNLDDEVMMPGWVDELDMPYLYSAAEAFIFPSKYEGFGIPLLQAMACGVPIAASWASSIPEVVGKAGYLFNPSDVNRMADAMERVVTDENLRKELVELGFARVKEFSWEECAKQTLEVIKGLE